MNYYIMMTLFVHASKILLCGRTQPGISGYTSSRRVFEPFSTTALCNMCRCVRVGGSGAVPGFFFTAQGGSLIVKTQRICSRPN